MSKLPITVVLLTLNEEANLPGALDNICPIVEEVFIVDSLSTDATIEIALERNVGVVQREFTNFGDQWNWALERLPIETAWTLKLDPDERLSPELIDELRELLAGEPRCSGYSMRRRLWFMGKPMRQIQWVLRLWRTGTCRFSDVIVNEQPVVEGENGQLQALMEHIDSPDLHHWYEKQNRYTTMEAIMQARGDRMAAAPRLFGNEMERRLFFKKIFRVIPFRYAMAWVYHAVIKGAILDGRVGLAWTRLRIENYYRAIDYKVREMRTTGVIPPIPKAAHGDWDPRVLDSPLQRAVSRPNGEEEVPT
jgi:glycosyltransferase involved in cell wall biosynthesis